MVVLLVSDSPLWTAAIVPGGLRAPASFHRISVPPELFGGRASLATHSARIRPQVTPLFYAFLQLAPCSVASARKWRSGHQDRHDGTDVAAFDVGFERTPRDRTHTTLAPARPGQKNLCYL